MVAFEKTTGEHLFNTGNPRPPHRAPLTSTHTTTASLCLSIWRQQQRVKKKTLPLPLGPKMMTVMSALCVSPGPQGGRGAHSATRTRLVVFGDGLGPPPASGRLDDSPRRGILEY